MLPIRPKMPRLNWPGFFNRTKFLNIKHRYCQIYMQMMNIDHLFFYKKSRMNKIFRNLSFTGLSILFFTIVFLPDASGQSSEHDISDRIEKMMSSTAEEDTVRDSSQIVENSEDFQLFADKVTLKERLAEIDSISMDRILERESELFPADEFYEEWTTEYVNPYRNMTIPDSCTIDLTGFHMPIEGKLTSPYGVRRRRFHYGSDLKLQIGDTVRAAFDGKVRVKRYERKGYGYFLVLRHPNGLETVYGHLSEFLVDQDDIVKAGEPIALGGNTGRSTGPHLHLEFRFMGHAIDPGEIIDFNHFVTHSDTYRFDKKISGVVKSKYTTGKVAYHRIKKGDTLGGIARRYGLTVNQLCRLNNIKPTTTLRVGRSLRCS